MRSYKKILTVLLCGLYMTAQADVKLPSIFSDSMIMQRDKRNKIWGWADAGEKIRVQFANKNYATIANEQGDWLLFIDPQPAGESLEMTVSGKNSLKINHILMGDVWVCSGQSNMEYKFNWLDGFYKKEMKTMQNDNIRAIEFNNQYSLTPLKDAKVERAWRSVTPQSVGEFSAVAYFFANNLYDKYKIPIGLIQTEWGGTISEAWTSYEGLSQFPQMQAQLEKLKGLENKPKPEGDPMKVWLSALTSKDAINLSWTDENVNTSDWKTMNLPDLWENQGLNLFDGLVVFRKEINIEAADAGKDLLLYFKVDDIDTTYFNGVKVGATVGYNTLREYKIEGKLVKKGRNLIVIKALDTGGGGGIHGDASDLKVKINDKTLSLAGAWQYKVSVDFKDLPPYPGGGGLYPNQPTVLYNSMIAPIINYGIKGAIWYQGESNAGRAYQYRTLFPALIQDWRDRWGQGEFPFLFVQLTAYLPAKNQPSDSEWAELREAQTMTLSMPQTGMACIIDIGDAKDIHPKNKHDVGKRLALNAMKLAYDDKEIRHSGPIYKSMTVENDKIRLHFDHTANGLIQKGEELKAFQIAGPDKQWTWAKAKIEGNSIVVWQDGVKIPTAVRYAWANNPEGCNLFNTEGLPASPFRTDDWDGMTKGK
jgi:sialate O-acetylesterase